MIDVTGKRGISLGCGLIHQASDILHVDSRQTPIVDVVMDLDIYPWPLPRDWAEVVYAIDIIEHLDDAIRAMEEIWHICQPSAHVYVRGPYHGHPQAYRAMDHKRYLALDSLDLFVKNTEYNRGYGYYTPARFDKIEAKYWGAEICWTLRKAQTDDGRWTLTELEIP